MAGDAPVFRGQGYRFRFILTCFGTQLDTSSPTKARLGDFQPNRLSGRQINDEIKLARLLDRDVGRLLALENAINVAGSATIWLDRIWPVRDEAASGNEGPQGVDRRQTMPRGKRDDQIAVTDCQSGRHHD